MDKIMNTGSGTGDQLLFNLQKKSRRISLLPDPV